MSDSTSKIQSASIQTIIKERFGSHRGYSDDGHIFNSLKAINAALDFEPPFIEFDVSLVNGNLLTVHPPEKPLDALSDVLDLFRNKRTYPKIDIKRYSNESSSAMVNKVIDMVEQKQINFALISIGMEGRDKKDIMNMETHSVCRMTCNPKIKLNIDIAKYRPAKKEIKKNIRTHVKKMGDSVFSISPEINDENWDLVAQFACEHGINKLMFWLREWPQVANPKVTEETIRKALKLENKYPITVYFDINHKYLKDK